MSTIATAIPAGTYKDDAVHSSAAFSVKHMLATFRGSFARFNAQLDVAEDGRAKLVGTVPVDTVVVKDENLAAHLQSPEFFDAEQHPEIRSVAIEGHTDSSGRAALNQSLSERRAARVVSWLVEHGVAPDRLTAWGCAASRPLADDATDDGRQRNRRVEAIVLDPAPESVPDRSACRQVPMRAAPPR